MIVYLIKNGEDRYKIGYTDRKVNSRLKELQTASPTKLEVVHTCEVMNATQVERTMHRIYGHHRMEGEWFNLSKEEVNSFAGNCKKVDENIEFIKKYKI